MFCGLIVSNTDCCPGRSLSVATRPVGGSIPTIIVQGLGLGYYTTIHQVSLSSDARQCNQVSHQYPPIVLIGTRDSISFPLTTSRKPAQTESKIFQAMGNLVNGAGESPWLPEYQVHLLHQTGDAKIATDRRQGFRMRLPRSKLVWDDAITKLKWSSYSSGHVTPVLTYC